MPFGTERQIAWIVEALGEQRRVTPGNLDDDVAEPRAPDVGFVRGEPESSEAIARETAAPPRNVPAADPRRGTGASVGADRISTDAGVGAGRPHGDVDRPSIGDEAGNVVQPIGERRHPAVGRDGDDRVDVVVIVVIRAGSRANDDVDRAIVADRQPARPDEARREDARPRCIESQQAPAGLFGDEDARLGVDGKTERLGQASRHHALRAVGLHADDDAARTVSDEQHVVWIDGHASRLVEAICNDFDRRQAADSVGWRAAGDEDEGDEKASERNVANAHGAGVAMNDAWALMTDGCDAGIASVAVAPAAAAVPASGVLSATMGAPESGVAVTVIVVPRGICVAASATVTGIVVPAGRTTSGRPYELVGFSGAARSLMAAMRRLTTPSAGTSGVATVTPSAEPPFSVAVVVNASRRIRPGLAPVPPFTSMLPVPLSVVA